MQLSEAVTVAVGLGEFKISANPAEVLVAYGLGSCVGVGVYDPVNRVGGLLHAILPECMPGMRQGQAPGKYVNSGVEILLTSLEKAGARLERLQVRLAGGAKMLEVFDTYKTLPIGERNLQMAHNVLAEYHLPIQAKAVGGNAGRTLRIYIATGRMTVRSMGQPEQEF